MDYPPLPESMRRSHDFVNHPQVREDYRKENDAPWEARIRRLLAEIEVDAPEGFRKIDIEVYACPTPKCPDFFGHFGMPDFGARVIGDKDINFGPKPASEHRTRATCPTCWARGHRTERVRVRSFAFVPLDLDQLTADREAAAPPESTGIRA